MFALLSLFSELRFVDFGHFSFFFLPPESLFNDVMSLLFVRAHTQCISAVLLKLNLSCPFVTCTTAKQKGQKECCDLTASFLDRDGNLPDIRTYAKEGLERPCFSIRSQSRLLGCQPQNMKSGEEFDLDTVCQGSLPSAWGLVTSALLKQKRQTWGDGKHMKEKQEQLYFVPHLYLASGHMWKSLVL